jgi:hypothetical protein
MFYKFLINLVYISLLVCIIGNVNISKAQIKVDRHSVALFDSIPAQYKNAASNLRMMFMNRSVGANIYDGITCLSYPHSSAPNHCKRYEHGGTPTFPVDPSEVFWNGTWDCSNWSYQFWPDGCDNWNQKVQCFIDFVEQRIDSFDVVGFQFSYLEVAEGSTIANSSTGFFGNGTAGTANHYMQFQSNYTDKKVIWFTSSLARSIGTTESEDFNNQLRQYAASNQIILFDVADILSHTPWDSPCYDNRDGVPYSFGNNSENHPDDGQDIPAICQEYTTETEGGHLGSVSAGKIRVAKAFWVLMARIAGWDGVVTSADEKINQPVEFRLYQNYPNPFNPETKISWQSPVGSHQVLKVFDILGNEIATLIDEFRPAGIYETEFMSDNIPSGVYFYQVKIGDYMETKKMILAK